MSRSFREEFRGGVSYSPSPIMGLLLGRCLTQAAVLVARAQTLESLGFWDLISIFRSADPPVFRSQEDGAVTNSPYLYQV
jgi:hypothetical protein